VPHTAVAGSSGNGGSPCMSGAPSDPSEPYAGNPMPDSSSSASTSRTSRVS
jgi:hypothetical protein